MKYSISKNDKLQGRLRYRLRIRSWNRLLDQGRDDDQFSDRLWDQFCDRLWDQLETPMNVRLGNRLWNRLKRYEV